MHFRLMIFSADNVFIGISSPNLKSRSICRHVFSANGFCLPVEHASVTRAAANAGASSCPSSVRGQLVVEGYGWDHSGGQRRRQDHQPALERRGSWTLGATPRERKAFGRDGEGRGRGKVFQKQRMDRRGVK